jgi:hypothetical protein
MQSNELPEEHGVERNEDWLVKMVMFIEKHCMPVFDEMIAHKFIVKNEGLPTEEEFFKKEIL